MTDKTDSLNEIHREVGHRRIAAGEARSALLRRRYDASINDVWDACTKAERIGRWLMPVTGDLRVGGNFSLEGNASGEILACEPPRLLRVSWVTATGLSTRSSCGFHAARMTTPCSSSNTPR